MSEPQDVEQVAQTDKLDPPIFPLGLVDSTMMFGSTAAPLLAGFALTILVLVLPTTSSDGDEITRWPELVLFLLTLAAASFVFAVQAAGNARARYVTPQQAEMWLSETDMEPKIITRHRNANQAEVRKWLGRTRVLYHVGILLLFGGVSIVIFPPVDHPWSPWRVLAIVVAAGSALIEFAWIVANSRKK